MRGLEHFHDRAGDMVEEDDLGFVEAFEFRPDQHDLDDDSREKQEIVAAEDGAARIDIMGGDQQADHQTGKHAGHRLFEAEPQEFISEQPKPRTAARPLRYQRIGGDKAAQRPKLVCGATQRIFLNQYRYPKFTRVLREIMAGAGLLR